MSPTNNGKISMPASGYANTSGIVPGANGAVEYDQAVSHLLAEGITDPSVHKLVSRQFQQIRNGQVNAERKILHVDQIRARRRAIQNDPNARRRVVHNGQLNARMRSMHNDPSTRRVVHVDQLNARIISVHQNPNATRRVVHIDPIDTTRQLVQSNEITVDGEYVHNNKIEVKRKILDSDEIEALNKSIQHDHNYTGIPCLKKSKIMVEEVENEIELGVAETYATYMPSKLKLGREHPDPVVETASLSSVAPVDVWYRLSIPQETIDSGALSALQLESITYASQAHEQVLPDGSRAGFLIGDGAGVGKGRTIAGIILENFLKGRKRAVWVSVSNDLKYDAERDLRDIGAPYITVHQLNKFKYGFKISSKANARVKEGVLFCTYSSLLGESNTSDRKAEKKNTTEKVDKKYFTRKQQILQWFKDHEGLLIFDECHKAKNLCTNGSVKATKTGQMVLELQNLLKKARVLYASATGASEPKNMAYMTRLGLWGLGTTFRTFDDFTAAVEAKGVGGMEIVAMDMKLRGMYIARQLSFQDVTFNIHEVPISKDFKKIYDASVQLWVEAYEDFNKAAELIAASANMRKTMMGQFWAAHQRFFKYICIAAKVATVVQLVREAMAKNYCVVIGLQSTGESGTLDQLEKGDGELSDFVSTAKGVFQNLVEKHFPASNRDNVNRILSNLSAARGSQPMNITKRQDERALLKEKQRKLLSMDDSDSDTSNNSDDDDSDDSGRDERERLKKQRECEEKMETMNNYLEQHVFKRVFRYDTQPAKKVSVEDDKPRLPTAGDIDEANELKYKLLEQIDDLGKKLPKNTLDELIDTLGGPDEVAEMTGRKGRVVQGNNGVQYQSRSERDVPLETLNVKEKQRFMDGDKLVAIISEAASSGISLQSDRRALNKLKRYHITLELPWSADKAVQQFGRTHRSNQVSAPEYVFLITDLAGERRFASTVAKRLESLGALTHGDRRASDNKDLSQFNIDNKYGKAALDKILKVIVGTESPLVPPPTNYNGSFFKDCAQALIGVGILSKDPSKPFEKDYNNLTKFLNRILGITVDLQNSLFQYFTDTLNELISIAKSKGTFDLGILDLCSNDKEVIRRVKTTTFLYKHATGTAPIELHKLVVEKGMSWTEAMQIFEEAEEDFEGFFESHQNSNGKRYVILLIKVDRSKKRQDDKENYRMTMYRPNTGKQNKRVIISDITLKYRKVEPDNVRDLWNEQYNSEVCSHVYWNGQCASGPSCVTGLRKRTYHVLAGSVLQIWLKIEGAIKEQSTSRRDAESKMQVIRLKTNDNMKIVGTLIKNNLVDGLVAVLQKEAVNFKESAPGLDLVL